MANPTLASYFRGYLTITVTSPLPERFITLCAENSVLLWDIVRISKHSIRCRISVSHFFRLRSFLKGIKASVHINVKHGLPFLIKKYQKRKIVLLSLAIIVLSAIVSNFFVWGVEVRGNHNVPSERIISVLNESGLRVGTIISKIDQQELKRDALLKIPELAWLWVDKKGSKIIVDVREKITPPEIASPDDYFNLVAKSDGIIKEMEVKNGVPVVEVGDTVLKDTVLVTGKIPVPAREITRYVRASAKVFARVWYERCEKFPLTSETRNETKESKTQYTLSFLDNKIRLFHRDKIPYENYDLEEKTYSFLGITLHKKTYREIFITKEPLNYESVVSYGEKQLTEKIETEVAPDSKKLSLEVFHKQIDDSTVEVRVVSEYLENIAIPVKSEIPLDENLYLN